MAYYVLASNGRHYVATQRVAWLRAAPALTLQRNKAHAFNERAVADRIAHMIGGSVETADKPVIM